MIITIFFLSVKPMPNIAMSNISVKIIIGTLPAPTLKLNNTKNITAKIDNIQNIDFDFCFDFAYPTPPFAYHFLIV